MIIWLLLTYHWSGFDLPLIRLISPARSSPLIVHMRSRLIGARTIPPLSAMVSCSKVTHTPGAVVSWVGTTRRFPSTPRPVIKQDLPWQHDCIFRMDIFKISFYDNGLCFICSAYQIIHCVHNFTIKERWLFVIKLLLLNLCDLEFIFGNKAEIWYTQKIAHIQ